MTTNIADMDVLKEIPGYKAIMKAVLKTQIQLLVEQLCDHTGEESIILTASVNDGSLSHLGSDLGKGFLHGREEIKSQFLGYCLKGHHKKKTQETEQPYQRSNISQSQPNPRTPLQQQGQKRSRVHPVSLSKAQQAPQYPASDTSYIPPAAKRQYRERTRSQEHVSDIPSESAQNIPQDSSVPTLVKQESDNQDDNQQVGENIDSNFPSQPLPPSLQLSHTQTLGEAGYSDSSQGNADVDSEARTETSIKIEPVSEADMDLEITGIEMGEGTAANWGQNVSGAIGYGSSDAGDSSFDQSANQSGYALEHKDASDDDKPLVGTFNASFMEVLLAETRLQCEICGKQFRRKDNLKRHSKTHLDTPQIHCKLCNQYFDSDERLQKHRLDKHENSHLCSTCGKTFAIRTALKKHAAIHHPRQSETPTEFVQTCPYEDCGNKFTQKSKFKDHMNLHTGEKPYSCAHCEKKFTSRYRKNEHENVCGKEVSLSCSECTLSFSSKDSLKRHTAAKHQRRSYACGCGKVFAYQSALCRHRKNKNH